MQRTGSATWMGDLKSGRGHTSTGSGGLRELNYSFTSRFEQGPGTNPEELIAAAHAACFSMALSKILGDQGHPPQRIDTKATLTLSKLESGFRITRIHLATEGAVPGLSSAGFEEAAQKAKENCPVSQLVKPGLTSLTVDARLV
ncbi:MAG: OsmC family protein [Verrucomicrobiota bacterium]